MNTNTETSVAAPNTVRPVDGEALRESAAKLALIAGSATQNAIEETEDTKDILRESTFTILSAMTEDYVTDDEDKLASFPRPDSDTGNNPDKFKIKGKNAKGETVMRPTTFYVQFVGGLAKGKALLVEADAILAMLDDKASKANVPDKFKTQWAEAGTNNSVKAAAQDRLAYVQGRFRGMVANVKKAMKLYFQLSDVQALEGIGCEVQSNDAGKVNFMPIFLYKIKGVIDGEEIPDFDKCKHLSLGNFLKINVAKAKEMDGGATYDNLLATLKREQGEEGGDGKNKPQDIETAETAEARLGDIAEYFDRIQRDKTGAEWGTFLKRVNANGSDDLIENLFLLKDTLVKLCSEPKVAKRFAAIQEAELKKAV